jgi:CRP-like cAMP-binding protein
MKCPKCQTELPGHTEQCNSCGYQFGFEDSSEYRAGDSKTSVHNRKSDNTDDKRVLKPLSGFRRTLSSELVQRQDELRVLMALNELIQSRTYEPGEVLIREGETNRDLYFLTEGLIEISMEREKENFILNEIVPPYILGDIAFLSGFPRTATATAKTKVEAFIMKHENLMNLSSEFPEWLRPLMTSVVSGIKSLHFTISELKKEIIKLKKSTEQ